MSKLPTQELRKAAETVFTQEERKVAERQAFMSAPDSEDEDGGLQTDWRTCAIELQCLVNYAHGVIKRYQQAAGFVRFGSSKLPVDVVALVLDADAFLERTAPQTETRTK